ncbi:MAG: hypothetical protein AAFY20_25070, partial [Cyanobacteria bacterium J06639_14]
QLLSNAQFPETKAFQLFFTTFVSQPGQELASKYEIQLRISIHMEGWNQGFDLSSEIIQQIAAVGAKIVFDIYAYADDDVEDKA